MILERRRTRHRRFILVANGIRWLEPEFSGPGHDFTAFEKQRKDLEGRGQVINEFGYVVKAKKAEDTQLPVRTKKGKHYGKN